MSPASEQPKQQPLWSRLRASTARCAQALSQALPAPVVRTGRSLGQRLLRFWRMFTPDGEQLAKNQNLDESTNFAPLVRYVCLAIVFALLFIGLAHHIYNLQITRHQELSLEAQKLYTRMAVQQAQRGKIYDLAGNLLAGNIAIQNVYAEPKRFSKKNYHAITKLLADTLQLDYNELDRRFQSIQKHEHLKVCIKDFVDLQAAHHIVNAALPGVTIEYSQKASGLFKVIFRPTQAGRHRQDVVNILARILDLTAEDIDNQILRAFNRPSEIVVKRHVDYSVAHQLKTIAEKKRYRGIRIEEGYLRNYPHDRQLANLIGFLDHDGKGVSGIEALFDAQMQPTPGTIQFERDGRNRMIPQSVTTMSEPENGTDVYLTITLPIQQIVEEELQQMVATHKPKRAYAIMMNPKTGAIMALAQYPSFNPNDRSTMTNGAIIQPHAFLMGFEPGSIMKGISIAAVMEQRPIELGDVFYCERGAWRYGGRTLHDSSGSRFEDLTVLEIVKKSSNIGTAKIALETEEKDFYQHLLDFGFGRRTGVGFIPARGEPVFFRNESHGRLPGIERWSKVSITRIPIGQGILCTPMQMVQAYGALANHGIMMQPYIVAKTVTGDVSRFSSPQVKGQPIQPETARKITLALKEVTTKGGTGTRAAVPGFEVAGKTGTAQKWISDPSLKAKGYYSHREYVSSFIGYVPADNPEFVLLVTADTPSAGSHYGGTVAGPVFSKIAERTLRFLQIAPTIDTLAPPALTTSAGTAIINP
ncbi:MAG: penicillin-binding protein 2 [Lentisphaerae bacterium]|jgi:cell division protein FtsI/penicillin-binding protein 2|nr:penicillin-binding protein 2 [Lentisphaerota bacterium]